MTHITLQRLTLDKFKGIDHLEMEFGGRGMSIYGDNASGKTTVYDAYLWLLTGRDSLGRSDFEIKPLDSLGRIIDHAARSTVEAVLSVDGREVTLRREYYEVWSRKRGRTDATYDGNSTDYYINGVPKSKRAYEEAVEEIIPLDKLRLLSETAAFAALPWKQRREILFDLADIGTDLELMGTKPEYAPLLDAAASIGLDDLRATLKVRRRKINGRLSDLPLLIAENRKTEAGLGEVPYDSLRASLADLEEDEHRLTGEIAASEAGDVQGLQNRLDALRLDLSALEQDNQAHRREQAAKAPDRIGLVDKVAFYGQRLQTLTASYKIASDRYHQYKQQAAVHEASADEYRRMWMEESAKTYSGTAVCPTCGQPLPADKQAQARQRWEQTKADKLAQIQGLGSAAADNARQMLSLAQEAQDDMTRIEGEIAQAKQAKAEAEAALTAMVPPEITDMPDYVQRKQAIQDRIAEAQDQVTAARNDQQARTDDLRRKRQAIRVELQGIRAQLAKEDTLRGVRARIAELEQERHQLAEELAQIDQLTDLADDFTRYKGEHVTETINGLFRLAQFRLFAEQVNGETPPACDILCGGVPYDGGLNNGARTNVGLDIIRTLGRYYGYAIPVFVDNAESVTDLEPIDTQVIRLVVSEGDKELRVV